MLPAVSAASQPAITEELKTKLSNEITNILLKWYIEPYKISLRDCRNICRNGVHLQGTSSKIHLGYVNIKSLINLINKVNTEYCFIKNIFQNYS